MSVDPGSQADYLARLQRGEELPHGAAWYAASGPVALSRTDRLRLMLRTRRFGATTQKFWLDWSGARLTAAQLEVAVQTGAVGCSRYIAPNIAATQWKLLTAPERDLILKYLDIKLNFEWYSGRALEGAAAGTEDGKTILAMANALAYPHDGRTIAVSNDTGTVNDAAVIAYYKAVRAELDGTWGVQPVAGKGRIASIESYGSYHTVTTLNTELQLAPYPWQTIAWSNGMTASVLGILQDGKQWFSGSVDENLVKHLPWGTWHAPYPDVVPPPPPPPKPGLRSQLTAGQRMNAGQALTSADGSHQLVMQTDGNLVIYHDNQATWASNTVNKGGVDVVMQTDGNFVMYAATGHPVWNTGTEGKGGVRVVMQSDGNLVIYTAAGKAVWATGTNGR